MNSRSDRPSDDAVFASISESLRLVVLPQLTDPWSRNTVAQLIGLADLCRVRGADPADEQAGELVEALRSLSWCPWVSSDESVDPWTRAADALVHALGRVEADNQADHDQAVQVQTKLRPLLVRQLDAELSVTMSLMDGFRGRVRDV